MVMAEPYKIKEVKKMAAYTPYERWNLLKQVNFNTFHVPSDFVSFDLVARGMSAWSHFQKAGYMVGDEAYAGSRNYFKLEKNATELLGIKLMVPTHNGIGAEKLLCTTMLKKGQTVLHNRGRCDGLVVALGGKSVDVTDEAACRFEGPEKCLGNFDLQRLESQLKELGKDNVAYIHAATCPEAWNGQPISLANLEKVSQLAKDNDVPLVVDISYVVTNAHWNRAGEGVKGELIEVIQKIVGLSDIQLMDASYDCRSDVGGFISSSNEVFFERFRNQVVVYEGLQTYGGMSGRAMDVFAVGIEETVKPEYVEWHATQIDSLYQMLKSENVPVFKGSTGIALDIKAFLPHLSQSDYPKFVLAAALFIHGGLRCRIDGPWEYNNTGTGAKTLELELPRNAYTRNHIREVADVIANVFKHSSEISGLELLNEPEFVDEAEFEAAHARLFVHFPKEERSEKRMYEPYKIAIFEPLKVTSIEDRKAAMEAAGYNTFLLDSEDIYIDFLTDSGTSAMSCYQWEGMTDSSDTPYSNRHYLNLVDDFREILGYNHIILTHQGRAAEHIMSQTMIKPGQSVPGNMYFTTTKLHQEMAGGVFVDIIVDEAHDPTSDFPWKGNIDIDKLNAEIKRVGAENIAYISFEMSVNMAGGQPFSMDNVKEVAKICQKHGIPNMFDATRCVENAYMIKKKDPKYANHTVLEILQEMLSYGDGCTVSCKKDFLVNMGGLLACNSADLNQRFLRMLRTYEGDITNGGMDPKDIEALHRGLLDSLDDDYIKMRIEQTQEFGQKLLDAGIPIVTPPGTHAIFLDAKRFLPHLDQDEYPAQALASALYIETGVRTMERGNVSKGRNPETGENYRPPLELVRCTIPRRVYTNSQIDYVVEGIKRLWEKRDKISGLDMVYEPKFLRFFQAKFETKTKWPF